MKFYFYENRFLRILGFILLVALLTLIVVLAISIKNEHAEYYVGRTWVGIWMIVISLPLGMIIQEMFVATRIKKRILEAIPKDKQFPKEGKVYLKAPLFTEIHDLRYGGSFIGINSFKEVKNPEKFAKKLAESGKDENVVLVGDPCLGSILESVRKIRKKKAKKEWQKKEYKGKKAD